MPKGKKLQNSSSQIFNKEEYLQNYISDNMVLENQIKSQLRKRNSKYNYDSVHKKLVDEYLDNGWEVDRKFKTKTRIKKSKLFDQLFEDQVWVVCAKLGFKMLNKDRNVCLPYDLKVPLTKQIDVLAVDDETILVIECKSTDGNQRPSKFKDAIEAFGGRRNGLIKSVKKIFGEKPKIKFVFATNNYILSSKDIERLNNFNIIHFDENIVKYFENLSIHLGISARFQLLGYLFDGQKIPQLDNKIPAIRGKMGGLTYYSFSIEPEKLLKIGYILHRNKANKKMMPTYQRLIKKSRIRQVQEFIEEGGFFPNSIVINFNTKRKLNFDLASNQIENAISKIGILTIPQLYRSAYIIDGQHRLYGYANSEYKSKNTIPVVAFENLDRHDQVKLFMQINENQKQVPKNLRNTLNADLLWSSDNMLEQIKALKLQIAQDLGEDLDSPLYNRVQVGENPKTKIRCITIDSIRIGLDRSNFFGKFSKTSIKEDGTFYKGNNQDTYDIFLPFIKKFFQYIADNLHNEWFKGENDDGYISINAGIESLIRISSDIIDHLQSNDNLNPKSCTTDELISKMIFYIDPIITYFRTINEEDKSLLKKSYGVAGRTKYWRTLQKVISDSRKEFIPDGLDDYLNRESKQFNEKSYVIIRELETYFKKDFKDKLRSHYQSSWFKKGVPPKVYENAGLLALQKNREIEASEDEKEPWDCLTIIDYRKIALYGSNWSQIFENYYTRPGEEKKRGGKDAKTKWLVKLEKIRNENFHSYSVTEEEFEFLNELYDWLILHKIENSL